MKTIFSHKRFKYHIFYFCENVINSSIILSAYNGMFYSSFIHFTLYYYVAAVVVVAADERYLHRSKTDISSMETTDTCGSD